MTGNDPGEVKPSPGSFGFLCMLLSVCFPPDTAVAGAVVSVKYGFPVFAAGGGKAHTDLLIGILLPFLLKICFMPVIIELDWIYENSQNKYLL